MMEKEALTHNIADDLAARNRNWDKIDEKFDIVDNMASEVVNARGDYTTLGERLDSQKEDYANYQNSNNLKIAAVEKELNDYKSTMANVNVNQEAKQKAIGYGIVSLPKNASNGQVSMISVKGATISNPIKNGSFESGFDNWYFVGATPRTINNEHSLHGTKSLKFNSVKQNSGMYQDIFFPNGNKIYVSTGVFVSNYIEGTAILQAWGYGDFTANLNSNANVNTSIQDKWQKVNGIVIATNGGVRLYPRIINFEGACYFDALMAIDLTSAFGAGKEPTLEQCNQMFSTYFTNTKSTVSASRLKSESTDKTQKSLIYLPNVGELRSVGIVKDEIIKADGVWKHIKRIDNDGVTILATPIITPIQVSGNLISYPSGTVYVENVVADAGVYTDKITVLHQDLPIKAIEKLSVVNFTTGVETKLDISKAVIAADKKSFTHPDLADGDIVFFEYEYDLESTVPEIEVEHYDSRYVLKDSVTGKFYKIVPTVANGILTNQLVEV